MTDDEERLDEPFMPVVGDLYWVNTQILWSGDRKPTRPVVVVETPAEDLGRIAVVTRTTDTTRKGVPHDPVPELGLHRPGVFADFGSTESVLWTLRNVRRLGVLASDVLAKVMERFG
jgi:mRNA-degrading endonuclease toxin of MazEF toxin-antitoxin module